MTQNDLSFQLFHQYAELMLSEKTLEELPEALETLESVLDESVEVQTAIDHMVAVVCKKAEISCTGVWDKHYRSLASAGYIVGA